MRLPSVQNHYPDATLLALADGELGRLKAAFVRRHLSVCWECRARSAELDAEARTMARLMAAQQFPGPGRTREARNDFERWRRTYEAMSPSESGHRPLRMALRPIAVAAAFAVVLMAGAAFVLRPLPKVATPTASTALDRARTAELRLADPTPGVVHQVVEIETTSSLAPRKRAVSRLEVWSDASTTRYASRLTDGSGHLVQAAWRPAAQERMSFEQGAGLRRVPNSELTPFTDPVIDLFSGDVERMERLTVDWLRSRMWRTVSLTDDFASFASRDGVKLAMFTDHASGLLRLVAEGTRNGVTVQATLELDPNSYQPRLRTFKATSARDTFAWTVRSRTAERVAANLVRPAVFRPGIEVATPSFRLPYFDPPPITAPLLMRRASPPDEIEILYALHRAQSCTRDVVRITPRPDGGAEVGVLTPSEDIAVSVRAALDQLQAGAWLDTEVEVRPVAMAQPRALRSAISPEAHAAYQQTWKEALALVRLAEVVQARKGMRLTVTSAWLLDSMVRDHLHAVENSLARLRAEFPTAEAATPARNVAAAPAAWEQSCFALFRKVDQLVDLLEDHGSRNTPSIPSQRLLELRAAFDGVHVALQSLRSNTELHLAEKYGIPPAQESEQYHNERNYR